MEGSEGGVGRPQPPATARLTGGPPLFHLLSTLRRLAQDGGLLGRLTRMAVETVLTFYAARAGQEGGLGAKSGAVTAVQSTSSD